SRHAMVGDDEVRLVLPEPGQRLRAPRKEERRDARVDAPDHLVEHVARRVQIVDDGHRRPLEPEHVQARVARDLGPGEIRTWSAHPRNCTQSPWTKAGRAMRIRANILVHYL